MAGRGDSMAWAVQAGGLKRQFESRGSGVKVYLVRFISAGGRQKVVGPRAGNKRKLN